MGKSGQSAYRKSFEIIQHLTKPNPIIFWADLLGSAICCYSLMYACMQYPLNHPLKWVLFISCSIFVNRGIYFMHEIFHQTKFVKGFEIAHNLLFGCVFKFPSYITFPHHFHHRTTTYGTQEDPEYDGNWIGKSFFHYFSVLVSSLFMPAFLFVRFGIMPLLYPFIGQTLRNKIYQRISTFALNPTYLRPLPNKEEFKNWMIQDYMTFAINSGVLFLLFTHRLSLENFITFHMLGAAFFFPNFYRALIAHRYVANTEDKTIEAQLADSISIPNSKLDFFLAPVGLKYHSLHHYFPMIPYHNMKKAHDLLVLAKDQNYLQSLEPSVPVALHKAFSGENLKQKASWEKKKAA